MTRQLGGLRAWLVQRLTALYLSVFVLAAAGYLLVHPVRDHVTWHGLIARPLPAIAIALAGLALLSHAWVGVRDIILDYVRPPTLRLALLALLWGWLLVLGLWLARILAIGAAA